jgi:uncharacterized protein (TIGR02246 family)
MTVTEVALTEELAAARATIDGVVAAWEKNDANAFVDHYTDDATLVTVEGIYCKGKEQIRKQMTMLYATVFKDSKVFDTLEDIRLVTDDVAIAITWNAILLGHLEELPPEETRRATWVLSKQDGRWLVEAFQNVFITVPTMEAC